MVARLKPKNMRSVEGFTIIEVLIVMGVFGLITVIIFLALPALMRASHNNQRKQDVQTVLELVSRYELNNSGNIPDQGALTDQLTKYSKLTSYDISDIKIEPLSPGSNAGTPNLTSPDQLFIKNYQKCSTGDVSDVQIGGSVATGAGYNDVVALYTVETLHGFAAQCQQI